MKRNLLLSVCAFFMALTASAQWNVQAGLNLSDNNGEDAKTKLGYNIGIGYETSTAKTPWSFQTGLYFQSKGAKADEGITMTANYLEVPLCGAYTKELNNGMKLVFSTGPYLAYGISGKTTVRNIKGDTFSDNGAGVKRFELGANYGVGLKIDKWTVGIQAQMAVTKMFDTDDSPKNSNLSFIVKFAL